MSDMISGDDFLTIMNFALDADRDELQRVLLKVAATQSSAVLSVIDSDTWRQDALWLIREGAGKVTLVKGIRATTGYGLREAKEAAERIAFNAGLEFGRMYVLQGDGKRLTLREMVAEAKRGHLVKY